MTHDAMCVRVCVCVCFVSVCVLVTVCVCVCVSVCELVPKGETGSFKQNINQINMMLPGCFENGWLMALGAA